MSKAIANPTMWSANAARVGSCTIDSLDIAITGGVPCPFQRSRQAPRSRPVRLARILEQSRSPAEAFLDGWIRSGDLATVDEDGC